MKGYLSTYSILVDKFGRISLFFHVLWDVNYCTNSHLNIKENDLILC